MTKLDGPFISPQSGKAKQLVIILHGYGDSGQGILGLGHEWAESMPDAAFVAPNAIDVCEAYAAGFQWFAIRAAEGVEAFRREDVIRPAHEALNSYIDEQLAKWGVDDSALAVAGFSQGAMMAMYTMPRRKKPCAAVLAYSGMLVGAAGLNATSIVKPPVLIIHGSHDDVVPPKCLTEAEEGLSAAGFEVEAVMRNGLAHSIDQFGLMRGVQFMQEAFENQSK